MGDGDGITLAAARDTRLAYVLVKSKRTVPDRRADPTADPPAESSWWIRPSSARGSPDRHHWRELEQIPPDRRAVVRLGWWLC